MKYRSVIIGARKIAQLDDNLKSVDLTLSADDLNALGEASAVAPEFGMWARCTAWNLCTNSKFLILNS